MKAKGQLSKVAARASISITKGRLEIIPHSGKPIMPDWLAANKEPLLIEILALFPMNVYQYVSYNTGCYGPGHSYKGVNLSFIHIQTGEPAYAIFNAELDRDRNNKNGKKGTPLPKGQFRITKNCLFYSIWKSTGVAFPKRLGLFHDYMGKLKPILFTFEVNDKNKADNQTIKPLEITYAQIKWLE